MTQIIWQTTPSRRENRYEREKQNERNGASESIGIEPRRINGYDEIFGNKKDVAKLKVEREKYWKMK